jgi:hypothetical protein
MNARAETRLVAGAAVAGITPLDSQFLFGYPHVARYSTGVHDPLLSSALYVADGNTAALIVANDVIFIGKATAARVRNRIAAAIPLAESRVTISATHTHSGPITVDYLSNEGDPIVPKADPKYIAFMEDRMVEAAVAAYRAARPAEIGLAVASGAGVGTNRRAPSGPSDPEVPVLMIRSQVDRVPIACMVVYSMHPTVLHEASTLVSADFPGMTRQFLHDNAVGAECAVLYHTGPAGNQSPRHVTRANTFDEAARLGRTLGGSIAAVIPRIEYRADLDIACRRRFIDLARRRFPSVENALSGLDAATLRLERLRREGAPPQAVRIAECDTFGAEETVTLARGAADGRLEAAYVSCLPAEIQVLRIGPWNFVAWPGEVFVEYALAVKKARPNTFAISLANGELQGYIVTEEAVAEGGYEAANALFGPRAGQQLVEATLEMLD